MFTKLLGQWIGLFNGKSTNIKLKLHIPVGGKENADKENKIRVFERNQNNNKKEKKCQNTNISKNLTFKTEIFYGERQRQQKEAAPKYFKNNHIKAYII